MTRFKEFFKFPVILADGDHEERKQALGMDNDGAIDYVIGEAEVSMEDDIARIEDRWFPTDDSWNKAMHSGKFDSCSVIFIAGGQFNVAWNKARFKKEYSKFGDSLKSSEDIEDKEIVSLKLSSREGGIDFINKLFNKLENNESDSKTTE